MKNIKMSIQMKNYTKAIALLLVVSASLLSCNKDEYTVIGDDLPTTQALNNLYDGKLASLTTVQTFDASTTLNYTSPKGVKLTINGSSLRKNGNPVTGQIKVKYIELFDKGTMLTANKATMGNNAGEQNLLVSGGEFYIKAYQEDVELTLALPITLQIPTELTGGPDTAMLPFKGTINAEGELTWTQAPTVELFIAPVQGTTNFNYNVILDGFGWFNCDRFYNNAGPKTAITTFVPSGYGNGNSDVFLVVKSIPNSLGKTFGQFPVGLDCYLVFVTEQSGKFRYAIKPQVLTANHQATFNLSETTLGTKEELTTAINALP